MQSKGLSATTMTAWIPSATWKAVPGGLADYCQFQNDMRRALDAGDPWIQLSIFGSINLKHSKGWAHKHALSFTYPWNVLINLNILGNFNWVAYP